MRQPEPIRLFLCGDVMTGRGLDQVLPHPGDPRLYETYVRDARRYVHLAEEAHGPIPRPVEPEYPWGDALPELRAAGTEVRIVNLETSITTSGAAWPGKGIHYRMHPANVGCLRAFAIDCCCLANNHVLDWGYAGLTETLETLQAAAIPYAGAGHTAAEAASPAIISVPGKGRVLVFSFGSTSSGIPEEWRAARDRPGVWLLADLSEEEAVRVAGEMRRWRQPGDVVVASVHWGGNWGYEVPPEQVRFAHRLIEEGADLVHGHSSHHVKPLEVYRDRLILYGCGDLLDDYEGIRGYERFDPARRLLYLLRLAAGDGRLVEARLVPVQVRRFRLQRGGTEDTRELHRLLNRLGAPFGTDVEAEKDGSLHLRWQ